MKRRSNAGFSLAEMLVTVLIMLLVSLIMVNGIPAAVRAYERVVVAGNARLLMSTTISVLRDELSTARDVKLITRGDGKQAIHYYSMDRGAECEIYLDPDPDDKKAPSDFNQIWINEYMDLNPTDPTGTGRIYQGLEPRTLITRQAGNRDNLRVHYDSVTWDPEKPETITINNLAVYKVSGSTSTPVNVGMKSNAEGSDSGQFNLTVRILMPAPSSTSVPASTSEGGE